jgi:serine/threonine protein kinase
MKQGEIIHGYRIISEPTNAGGGRCMWAFAEKDGREYFFKQFLEPKRPAPDSRASEVSKKLRMEECREFEERHRVIASRLRPDASGAGNIILALDFFHEGSSYYKVTEKIDSIPLETPQALDPRQKAVLLRTLGLSLRLLHDIEVVHGDLKPANVLIRRKAASKAFYTAKLIDFDDSYVSKNPPERDAIVGDSQYGAPEWRRYLQGDEDVRPEHLTTNVDIFALGLLAHYYLTGSIPRHHPSFGSPADAVNAGADLRLDERMTSGMRDLVDAAISRAPGRRPSIDAILKALEDAEICALSRRRPRGRRTAPTAPGPVDDGTRTSRIRTNLNAAPTHSRRAATPPGTAGAGTSSVDTAPTTGTSRPAATSDAVGSTSGRGSSGASGAGTRRASRVRINITDRRR